MLCRRQSLYLTHSLCVAGWSCCSVFWRCLPVYDKTSSENQRCTFPESVLSVSDPACAVKLVTAGSTEERLAR